MDLLGKEFSSFREVKTFLNKYQKENNIRVICYKGAKLSSSYILKNCSEKPLQPMRCNKSLRYYNLLYRCVPEDKKNLEGESQKHCPFFLQFSLTKDCQRLTITAVRNEHNHINSKSNHGNILKRKRFLHICDTTDEIKKTLTHSKKPKKKSLKSESNKIPSFESDAISDKKLNNIDVKFQFLSKQSTNNSDNLNNRKELVESSKVVEGSVKPQIPPLLWYTINQSQELKEIKEHPSTCLSTMSKQEEVIGVPKSETLTRSSTVLPLTAEPPTLMKAVTMSDQPLCSVSPRVTSPVKDIPPLAILSKSGNSLVEKISILKSDTTILAPCAVPSTVKGSVQSVPPLNLFKTSSYLPTENSLSSRPSIQSDSTKPFSTNTTMSCSISSPISTAVKPASGLTVQPSSVPLDPSVWTSISSITREKIEMNHSKLPFLDSFVSNTNISENNGIIKSGHFNPSTSGDSYSKEKQTQSFPLLTKTNTPVTLPMENNNLSEPESVSSPSLSKSKRQPKSMTSLSTTSTISTQSQTLINTNSDKAYVSISSPSFTSTDKNRLTVISKLPKPHSTEETVENSTSSLTVSKGDISQSVQPSSVHTSNVSFPLSSNNIKNSKLIVQRESSAKILFNETIHEVPPLKPFSRNSLLSKECPLLKSGFKVSKPVLISINMETSGSYRKKSPHSSQLSTNSDSPVALAMKEDEQLVPPLAPFSNKTNDVGEDLTNSMATNQSKCEKNITKDTSFSPIIKNVMKQSFTAFSSTSSHKTENKLKPLVPLCTNLTMSSSKRNMKETEQSVPPLAPFATKSNLTDESKPSKISKLLLSTNGTKNTEVSLDSMKPESVPDLTFFSPDPSIPAGEKMENPSMKELDRLVPPLAAFLTGPNQTERRKNLTSSTASKTLTCEKAISSPIVKRGLNQLLPVLPLDTPTSENNLESSVPTDSSSLKPFMKEVEQVVPPLAPFFTKPALAGDNKNTSNSSDVVSTNSFSPFFSKEFVKPVIGISPYLMSATLNEKGTTTSVYTSPMPTNITECTKSIAPLILPSNNTIRPDKNKAAVSLPQVILCLPSLSTITSSSSVVKESTDSVPSLTIVSKKLILPPGMNRVATNVTPSRSGSTSTSSSSDITPMPQKNIDSAQVTVKVKNTSGTSNLNWLPIRHETISGKLKSSTIPSSAKRAILSLTVLPNFNSLPQGTQKLDSQPPSNSTLSTPLPDFCNSQFTRISNEINVEKSFIDSEPSDKDISCLTSNKSEDKDSHASPTFQSNYNKAMEVCKEICSEMAELPSNDFNNIMKSLFFLRNCTKKKNSLQSEPPKSYK